MDFASEQINKLIELKIKVFGGHTATVHLIFRFMFNLFFLDYNCYIKKKQQEKLQIT